MKPVDEIEVGEQPADPAGRVVADIAGIAAVAHSGGEGCEVVTAEWVDDIIPGRPGVLIHFCDENFRR